MSTRASTIPLIDASGFRQHVVRIQSVQSLDWREVDADADADGVGGVEGDREGRKGGEGEFVSGEKKSMVEYLVLQRRVLKGKEGPWLLWGTVQETDARKVLEDGEGRKGSAPFIDVVKAT